MAEPCSKTCGKGGMVKLMRTCDNPEPFCGGKECMGTMITMEECDLPDCPAPGNDKQTHMIFVLICNYSIAFLCVRMYVCTYVCMYFIFFIPCSREYN